MISLIMYGEEAERKHPLQLMNKILEISKINIEKDDIGIDSLPIESATKVGKSW